MRGKTLRKKVLKLWKISQEFCLGTSRITDPSKTCILLTPCMARGYTTTTCMFTLFCKERGFFFLSSQSVSFLVSRAKGLIICLSVLVLGWILFQLFYSNVIKCCEWKKITGITMNIYPEGNTLWDSIVINYCIWKITVITKENYHESNYLQHKKNI